MKSAPLVHAALALAALVAASPAAATQSGGNLGETETVNRADDDDGDFPWGLLGLLGLAGLAGLKRNDRDIHVDARRNP